MPWYRYSALPGKNIAPVVRIRLLHGVRQVQVLAIVDSGADSSLMDAGYAAVLGLDQANAKLSTSGVAGGGTLQCLSWPTAPVEIQFGHNRFPFVGQFAVFPANTDGDNLLGRSDFFQQYIVQFWEWAGMMNIDRAPQLPRPPLKA